MPRAASTISCAARLRRSLHDEQQDRQLLITTPLEDIRATSMILKRLLLFANADHLARVFSNIADVINPIPRDGYRPGQGRYCLMVAIRTPRHCRLSRGGASPSQRG